MRPPSIRCSVTRAALAGLTLLLAGCGDDDPMLLRADDLPSTVVSSTTGDAGFPMIGGCSGVNDALGRASTRAWADDGYRSWSYTLESGDAVSATVMDFDDATAAQAALTDVVAGRDECTTGSDVGIVTEPLDDLPDGAVGYRITMPTSSGEETGELVVAPTSGDVLVTAGVARRGDQSEVDVSDLLAAVEKRAADADLARKGD